MSAPSPKFGTRVESPRRWLAAGLVADKRIGGRWYADTQSLRSFIARSKG
jgi:hypothetical protein